MFYSQTFLARKGPLGTVWCAAHLQHKLKKSHYTSTNVFSTAERIMYPEVPIALRMSGHLLLGIVRIYSKQVDYLYQDCNVALIGLTKTFSSLNANQLEDATNAPPDSVSLPKVFELHRVEVDDNTHRPEDDHVKRPEDIELPDAPPSATQTFTIPVNEDSRNDTSVPEDSPGSGTIPMDEDSHPRVSGHGETPGDPSTSNQARPDDYGGGDRPTTGLSDDIEIMRKATDNRQEFPSIFPDVNDVLKPDGQLEELLRKEKEANTPPPKETPDSGGSAFRSHETPGMPSIAPEEALPGHGSPDLAIRSTLSGHTSPRVEFRHTPEPEPGEFALQPTPPIEQQRARKRRRKRQFYDEVTVLSNRIMKNSLEDTSNLVRVKRMRRCDQLGIWKQQNRLKKDSIFSDPLITGLSTDLCSIYNLQLKCSNPQSETSRGAHHAPGVAESSVPGVNNDMEIEYLRSNQSPGAENLMPVILPSIPENTSPPNMSPPPSSRRDENTPGGTQILTTPKLPSSTPFIPDTATPTTSPREGRGGQSTVLSDIPEWTHSPGQHLSFLEKDESPPAGTPVSIRVGEKEVLEFDTLPATTRAVGQYLKRQSSESPNSEYSSEILSLHSILENKSRKTSARMFFETLVLKSFGFVDVQQEDPYSPISLKVTSKLKEQSSG